MVLGVPLTAGHGIAGRRLGLLDKSVHYVSTRRVGL